MSEPDDFRATRFDRGDEVDRLIKQAVREALLDHRRAGNPVAIWRDGRVVIVPPEEIVLPEDPEEAPASDPE